MPTYEYVCDACEHAFEKFQSIKARPVRLCPECGQRKVRRLIGAGAGVIFKGSGFYQTDYRSESYRKAAEKDKPKSSSDSSSSGDKAKKAKKPEKTAETKPKAKAKPDKS